MKPPMAPRQGALCFRRTRSAFRFLGIAGLSIALSAPFESGAKDSGTTQREPVPAASPPAQRPIRLAGRQITLSSRLQHAHDLMQRNELHEARAGFEAILEYDPRNIDALLALAAIAQYEQRTGDAGRLRLRALLAAPIDPAVQAAILNERTAETDEQEVESRLKTLLYSHPGTAPLNFVLGNLYARQLRWPEARQAYYNAVAADGNNPDFLFNLAVAFDRTHQPGKAIRHYRQALAAARDRLAAFDSAAVHRRLSGLDAQP